MNLLSRFKKDYLNYLIGILLPAITAGIAVPLFKNLLGAEGYGDFSIYFNAAFICTAITTGWITQSIYRFYPSEKNKELFARLSISISLRTQLFFYLPVIATVWLIKSDLLLGLLLCIAIFINSMQFAYLSIAQSSFLSKKTIYSETIRSVSYIIIAIVLLLIVPHQYLYALFIAIIISYTLSIYYLRVQTRDFFSENANENKSHVHELNYKSLSRKFFKYGSPLSMWIAFAYLLPYIDKLMILKNMGPAVQGNYQAVFDFLYKGITVLFSPVIISLLPLLTQAYEKSTTTEIKKLMMKIILLEFAVFFLATFFYWWFGAAVLFKILKVPDTDIYRLMGFIIITGTFIWQIAMVVHQRYILKLKSLFLLYRIMTAFLAQFIFYWLAAGSGNPLIYPLGYLIATAVYLFLVSFSQVPVALKFLVTRIKF
jgi:O-antigen/teichoic acid export membrane protein